MEDLEAFCWAVAVFKDRRAVPRLIELMEQGPTDLTQAAGQAVATIARIPASGLDAAGAHRWWNENWNRSDQEAGKSQAQDKDPAVAVEAARELLELGDRDCVPTAIRCLKDGDAHVRLLALDVISKATGDNWGYNPDGDAASREKVVAHLEGWWKENHGTFRLPEPQTAAAAPVAKEPGAEQVADLGRPDGTVANDAQNNLLHRGFEACPALLDGLASASVIVRRHCQELLTQITGASIAYDPRPSAPRTAPTASPPGAGPTRRIRQRRARPSAGAPVARRRRRRARTREQLHAQAAPAPGAIWRGAGASGSPGPRSAESPGSRATGESAASSRQLRAPSRRLASLSVLRGQDAEAHADASPSAPVRSSRISNERSNLPPSSTGWKAPPPGSAPWRSDHVTTIHPALGLRSARSHRLGLGRRRQTSRRLGLRVGGGEQAIEVFHRRRGLQRRQQRRPITTTTSRQNPDGTDARGGFYSAEVSYIAGHLYAGGGFLGGIDIALNQARLDPPRGGRRQHPGRGSGARLRHPRRSRRPGAPRLMAIGGWGWTYQRLTGSGVTSTRVHTHYLEYGGRIGTYYAIGGRLVLGLEVPYLVGDFHPSVTTSDSNGDNISASDKLRNRGFGVLAQVGVRL